MFVLQQTVEIILIFNILTYDLLPDAWSMI